MKLTDNEKGTYSNTWMQARIYLKNITSCYLRIRAKMWALDIRTESDK